MSNFLQTDTRLLSARPNATSVRKGEINVHFECRADRTDCGKSLGCVAIVKAAELGTANHVEAMREQGICQDVLDASGASRLLVDVPVQAEQQA